MSHLHADCEQGRLHPVVPEIPRQEREQQRKTEEPKELKELKELKDHLKRALQQKKSFSSSWLERIWS